MYWLIRSFMLLAMTVISACSAPIPVVAEALPERGCVFERGMAKRAQPETHVLSGPVMTCTVNVYFETGRSTLAADARRSLDKVAPGIIAHLAQGGRVIIDGSTLDGFPDETAELSRQRARAVAAYLEAAWGIPQRRIALRRLEYVLSEGRDASTTAQRQRVKLVLLQDIPRSAARRYRPTEPYPGYLDLDDFGGASNPLVGPVVRIWTIPGAHHD